MGRARNATRKADADHSRQQDMHQTLVIGDAASGSQLAGLQGIPLGCGEGGQPGSSRGQETAGSPQRACYLRGGGLFGLQSTSKGTPCGDLTTKLM